MGAEVLQLIPGSQTVVDWFGGWPTFHDAEIIRLTLDRSDESNIDIHTFQMTDEVGADGHYILTKHAIVTFHLRGIASLSLYDFNNQNVLFGLSITHSSKGFSIELDPSYGLSGTLVAASLSVSLDRHKPDDGVYAQSRSA